MPDRPLKISCEKCGQHLDVTLLETFHTFQCPVCGENCIVPKRFDRYLLKRRIAVGGMAEVYLAHEEESGGAAAVKITTPPEQELESWLHRFQGELEMISAIDHPNILKLFRCGKVQNQIFISMEYLSCGDLEKFQHCPAPAPVICRWILQTAEGLAALLQAGLIHHDIKPGNLLLDNDDRIKICDFDLLEKRLASGKTLRPVYGSPDYVSPERLDSGREDEKGDVFSLGATAYELLTGQCPFPQGKNEAEMLQSRRETVPDVQALRKAGLPEPVSSMILQMLSFFPEKRPAYPEIIRVFAQAAELAPTQGGSTC